MKKIIYLGLVATFASPAMATTYEVELHDYPVIEGKLKINKHAPIAGYVDRFYSKYNDSTEQLNVSMTLLDQLPSTVATDHPEYNPKGIGDGFWVVLTDGVGPQSANANGKYTILLGDSKSKKVTSYAYEFTPNTLEGINKLDSRSDLFIQSFDNAFEVENTGSGEVTYSFDIEASGINSYSTGDWVGVQYSETIGIWAHPFFIDGENGLTYNADGSISNLDIAIEGWFDTPLNPTEDELLKTVVTVPDPVPVPAPVWFFATGLMGVAGIRFRNNKS